jgi:hypothetical protein
MQLFSRYHEEVEMLIRKDIRGRDRRMTAMSIFEVFVVVGLISIFALMVRSTIRGPRPSFRLRCVNNLKNIGLSVRIFATDHEDKFPQQISTNLGGCRELKDPERAVVGYFRCLSNELSTPSILRCPVDTRMAATNFGNLKPENLSYFVTWSAESRFTNMILAGDRNISPGPGWMVLNSATNLPWQPYRDGKKPFLHGLSGNVVTANDSVIQHWMRTELPPRPGEVAWMKNRIVVP